MEWTSRSQTGENVDGATSTRILTLLSNLHNMKGHWRNAVSEDAGAAFLTDTVEQREDRAPKQTMSNFFGLQIALW